MTKKKKTLRAAVLASIFAMAFSATAWGSNYNPNDYKVEKIVHESAAWDGAYFSVISSSNNIFNSEANLVSGVTKAKHSGKIYKLSYGGGTVYCVKHTNGVWVYNFNPFSTDTIEGTVLPPAEYPTTWNKNWDMFTQIYQMDYAATLAGFEAERRVVADNLLHLDDVSEIKHEIKDGKLITTIYNNAKNGENKVAIGSTEITLTDLTDGVDTNTKYDVSVESGTGSTVNTYTVTSTDKDAQGNPIKVQQTIVDTNTKYDVSTVEGTGSTVNTYTVTSTDKDGQGNPIKVQQTIVDTNTKYDVSEVSGDENSSIANTYKITSTDVVDGKVVTYDIVDTNTKYDVSVESGDENSSTVNIYTVTSTDKDGQGNPVQQTIVDTNTKYDVSAVAGSGSTVNTYTVTSTDKDEQGNPVQQTIVDTNTKYVVSGPVADTSGSNVYTISDSDGNTQSITDIRLKSTEDALSFNKDTGRLTIEFEDTGGNTVSGFADIGNYVDGIAQAADTDTHIKEGEYSVGGQNVQDAVVIDIIDKNNEKTGSVTITDVASAANLRQEITERKEADEYLKNAQKKAKESSKSKTSDNLTKSKKTIKGKKINSNFKKETSEKIVID